jgi:hypothetical protein
MIARAGPVSLFIAQSGAERDGIFLGPEFT